MKVIKRYSNRKLYDTEQSCYVTLDEIAEMVREGEELSIVDNRSGEDLTTVTLAQIVYEEEKRDRRLLPLHSLRMIIQSPSDFLVRLGRPLREETQQRVERLRRMAEEQNEEIFVRVRDFIESVRLSLDELGRTVEEKVKGGPDAPSHRQSLAEQIETLQSQLHALESEVSNLRKAIHGPGDDELLQGEEPAHYPGEQVC